jgi:hypothetical protein
MKIKLKIVFFIIFFALINSLTKAESIENLAQEVNDIRSELNSISSNSVSPEAVKIDDAIKSLNNVVDFANESFNKTDFKSAIEALELADVNIGEVIKSFPNKFDVSVVGNIKSMSDLDMAEVSEITAATQINKMTKEANFQKNILSLEAKGLDAVEITKDMVELGVGPLNAQQMLEDIKKAGSSEAYTQSAEYEAYQISMKELNKQMSLDMNRSLNDLLKKSSFKSTRELAIIAASQTKSAASGIKSEASAASEAAGEAASSAASEASEAASSAASAASEAAGEAASAASEAASEMASDVQEALSQTVAETMLADIQEMGSEAYTQSQAYADQRSMMEERNKKAWEELQKTMESLK